MRDLTNKGKKITVLRGFGNNMFCVCQGDNFYKGLFEMYKEFDNYANAVEYFNLILK